jgi:putative membrane protein
VKRKIFRILAFSICFMLVAFSITFAESNNSSNNHVKKSETVYVILDHDGKIIDERVVNRIYAPGQPDEISDYGEYISIRNMESSVQPDISGHEIKWNSHSLKSGTVYYEGITNKTLPVNVDIQYFLDGKKINAADLAGKSGTLKISIKATNNLKTTKPIVYENYKKQRVSKNDEHYVPLLVQVSCPVNLDIFHNIEAEDAVRVVTGKTMNLGFALFPYPDAEILFEMKGSRIELDPITITVVPQMPPIPEIEMEEDLKKLLDGVVEIRSGIDRFKSSITSLDGGEEDVSTKGKEFINAISTLSNGCEKLDKNSDTLISGFNSSIKGISGLKSGAKSLSDGLEQAGYGTDQLNNAAKALSTSVGSLKEGANKIDEAGAKMAGGLGELQKMGIGLTEQARRLMEHNAEGSDLYNLGKAILFQNEALNNIASASNQLKEGTKNLSEGMETLKVNVENGFVPGIEQLNTSMAEMHGGSQALASGLDEYEKGQTDFMKGLKNYTGGVKQTAEGMKALNENSGTMLAGLNDLFEAQEQITGKMDKMDVDGISEMEKGLIEALDEIRFGEAKKDRMKNLAESYRSFMDNENNKNSSIQFIMQTKKVAIPETGRTAVQKESAQKNFWQKLLSLFK